MNQATNETNLLQDVEQQIYLEPASKGSRFANYLIDVIVFYVFIFLFGIIYGIMLVSSGEQVDDSVLTQETGNAVMIQYLVAIIIIVGYYTIMEGATKGRTIGKFITGTQVVKEDGSQITWKDAFLRSLSRLVPFEPFSALGTTPWHDSWTNTTVIKKPK